MNQPRLLSYWDLSIFLEAPFEITVSRMANRDGGSPEITAAQNRRYVEGQRLYIRECSPREAASLVVENSDLEAPRILRTVG